MELREIKSFCTAAKLRSISKAAEQLGLAQPTVTTHIKKLEEEFGVALFDKEVLRNDPRDCSHIRV